MKSPVSKKKNILGEIDSRLDISEDKSHELWVIVIKSVQSKTQKNILQILVR